MKLYISPSLLTQVALSAITGCDNSRSASAKAQPEKVRLKDIKVVETIKEGKSIFRAPAI